MSTTSDRAIVGTVARVVIKDSDVNQTQSSKICFVHIIKFSIVHVINLLRICERVTVVCLCVWIFAVQPWYYGNQYLDYSIIEFFLPYTC